MSKSHLLLIPGLGDRTWLYRFAVPLWRIFGYEVHIHAFGWNGGLDEFGQRHKALVQAVDGLPLHNLYVVGASAGGLAAINLLAERPAIRGVITIASPLRPKQVRTKALLVSAFREADPFLQAADADVKRKIVSVHGGYDNRVPTELSRRPGIRAIRLPTVGHGPTIFFALSVYNSSLRRLMKQFV
jgi:pimeloyl-ACP methyl ester carboxylesterase